MKHLIYIILIIIAGFTGYWCGEQTWFLDINNMPHYFNTEEARLTELKYSNAVLDGLHYFYQKDEKLWKDSFMLTETYKKIEEVNQGEWEDFYCEW